MSLDFRNKGFSLVELLIVVAITGVLVAILLPVLGNVREQSQTTTCASNLRQLHVAIQLYANDNDGELAVAKHDAKAVHWTQIISPYLGGDDDLKSWEKPSEVCECPSWKSEPDYNPNLTWLWGYAMNVVPGLDPGTPEHNYRFNLDRRNSDGALVGWAGFYNLSQITYADRRPLFMDGRDWLMRGDSLDLVAPNRHGHGKCNVVFFDGHIEVLDGESILQAVSDPKNYSHHTTGS
ncbi:type II secretion system protein [Rubellicoccus peritrichatus]|uniref:Type II secretion system protein n=1 Tax=Rubellicoccus peritrichatus TaxID=3080537 RepID=A0AAQ3LAZ6_9BACT|nr:type II secretion system protein [Puniceicoccus sp. CR14]WOO42116.1 type II secretion system protein [Puniceicoccus sp. CR14]